MFTPKFTKSAKTFPNIIIVDDNTGDGTHDVYCIKKVIMKQTLQRNATREKNNNFRIPQLAVKLHYFAHY